MQHTKEYVRTRDGSSIGKIVIDRELCIAAASCIAVSDTTFELDQQSKVVVLDPNAADDATLIMAAESCPTKAIRLLDKDGIQVYPKP